MSGLKAIMGREVRLVFRERTIVLAILIQLVIASMSSLFLTGLIAFYSPESAWAGTGTHVNVGIAGDLHSPLVSNIESMSSSDAWLFGSMDDAYEAYAAGQIDAILYIPPDNKNPKNVILYLPPSESRASIILMVLKAPLKNYEDYLRSGEGITMNTLDVQGKPSTSYEFLYTLIVPLLMLFPAFIAGSMVVDTLSEEFENNTMDTLLSTPVSFEGMVAGKMCAAIIIAGAQCILWPLLLMLNGISIGNLAWVVAIGIAAAGLTSAGSVMLTTLLKDRERSQLLYSFLLLALAGAAYFVQPSPFNLLARLAMGDKFVNMGDIVVYLLIAVVVSIMAVYVARLLKPVKV